MTGRISRMDEAPTSRIKLYTSKWCAHALSVEHFLRMNDISVERINIDGDPEAREELIALNGGYDGLNVNWDAIYFHSNRTISGERILSGVWHNTAQSTPSDTLDHYLEQCKLIIIQVFNQESYNRGRSGQHWVLVTGKDGNDFIILDPGRGETRLSNYGGHFWGYVIVSNL